MKALLSIAVITAVTLFSGETPTNDIPVQMEGEVLPKPVTPEYRLSLELLEKIAREVPSNLF